MIRASKHLNEMVYNLRDICMELRVDYLSVFSQHRMKNMDILEYVTDVEKNEVWVSRAGLHICFYRTNYRKQYQELAKQL